MKSTYDSFGLVPRPRYIWEEGGATGSVSQPSSPGYLLTAIDSDWRFHGPDGSDQTDDLAPWQRDEAFSITCDADHVRVTARTQQGVSHGIRRWTAIATSGRPIPLGLHVMDFPHYAWRGLSLDIVRHFFGAEDIIRILTIESTFGMNVLHLHLSDDQGWRIPVPEYPELISESSHTAVGGDPGGHLTPPDIAAVLAHARSLGIAIVPEVDVPGHVNAAKHAVRGLNASGEIPEEYTGIEVGFSTLELAAPETEAFLETVAEVLAAMSDEAVHIGGDECHVTPPEDFAALVSMMANNVRGQGRKVVAWQEAADYLLPGDYAQLWDERLDMAPLKDAASRGVSLIMSPGSRVYLDMKYSLDEEIGLQWMGTTELRQSLEWDPTDLIPGVSADSIAGVEAAVFTETIRSFDDLTYMLLPRLAAVAEVAWAGSGIGQWDSFATRIAQNATRWGTITFHRSPGVSWPRLESDSCPIVPID